jgi:L-gulono-1,4-lactone dehydrogenase
MNPDVNESSGRPRVALVGCGWFAREAHIPALRRLDREGAIELVALCSRSQDSLARASSMLPGRNLKKYTELGKLLADAEVDLVDLLLPISAMPEAIRAVLRAGKHVISEKPCAPTVAASLELLDYHAGLPNPPLWAVAENWRFKKSTNVIEQTVARGEIGAVDFADFRYMTFAGSRDRGWRASPDYPGGALLDSGVHFVALLRKVVGEVARVSATVRQRSAHLPPADSVSAVLSFAGGAEGCFRVSFSAPHATDGSPRLALVGTEGFLAADFERNTIQIKNAAGRRIIRVRDDSWVPGGVYELLAHCVDALRNGTRLRSSAWDAMRDVAVIEAMIESNRTNVSVSTSTPSSILRRSIQPVATYADTWTFRPRYAVDCACIADVSAAVAAAAAAGLRVRAIANGLSWAPSVVTSDVCIRTDGMNRIRHLDLARKTVVVDPGVRLGDLTRVLSSRGLTLPSLSFLSDQSIGGAVATATHGTSPRWGTLSDSVRSMKLVLASGDVKYLGPRSRPEELRAARVGVGMLGVIVELEMQTIDMPWVRFSETRMDLDDFLSRWRSILSTFEHVWVQWTLGQDRVVVKCLESRSEPAAGFHPYVTDDNAYWENPRLHVRAVRGIRHVLRPAKVRWKRLSHAPRAPRQSWMSMQYGVTLDRLQEAVEDIRRSQLAKTHRDRIVELKFLKGSDQSHLGPNSDGDAVLFNCFWPVDEACKRTVFDTFEAGMRNLNAKPHWGKLHGPLDCEYMQAAYRHWSDFQSIRAKFDPAGIFSIFAEGRS